MANTAVHYIDKALVAPDILLTIAWARWWYMLSKGGGDWVGLQPFVLSFELVYCCCTWVLAGQRVCVLSSDLFMTRIYVRNYRCDKCVGATICGYSSTCEIRSCAYHLPSSFMM